MTKNIGEKPFVYGFGLWMLKQYFCCHDNKNICVEPRSDQINKHRSLVILLIPPIKDTTDTARPAPLTYTSKLTVKLD